MKNLNLFLDLTRLKKPIGFMLLFWPCAWGLTYAHHLIKNKEIFIYYLFLFFLGSVLMRSAGCIFNDIVDKDFDKKVQRTKLRPIAAKKIKGIDINVPLSLPLNPLQVIIASSYLKSFPYL